MMRYRWINYGDRIYESRSSWRDRMAKEIAKLKSTTISMKDLEEKLEIFRTFLIQYGLLDRVTEIIEEKKGMTLEEYCFSRSSSGDIISLIDRMCIWTELEEGHDYWREINNNWVDHINYKKYGISKSMILFKDR